MMKKAFYTIVLLLLAVACSNYGEKLEFNKGQLYYTENVSSEDAQKLGEYLVKVGFFDGNPKTVQLDRRNDTFLFRMVVKKEKQDDSNSVVLLKLFAMKISGEVFNGSPVNAYICDDRLKTVREIRYEGFGKRIRIKNGDLYYTMNVEEAEAQKLADFLLKNQFYGDEEKSVLIDRTDGIYQFKMVVKPEFLENPGYAVLAQAFGLNLSQLVFDNQPVEIHFCDSEMNTIKILKSN
ncbi:MAG: hypothetical protein GX437_03810 [Sphingobacteriales bacterium]|nr:hypothetical protein [Sphingobacteriales bacterium]